MSTRLNHFSSFQSDLSMETNQKSVTGAIEVLSSRLSLLAPSHLDHVEGRLAALLQKMNTISERKAVIEDAEKQAKVSELYDLCMKTEAESVVLPKIVDRLDSLQTLHEQGERDDARGILRQFVGVFSTQYGLEKKACCQKASAINTIFIFFSSISIFQSYDPTGHRTAKAGV